MKRQTDPTIATRVYTYGTVPARVAPVLNEDGAIAQMHLGQRLWNLLVAIERVRMERYKRIMTDGASERIVELNGMIDTARDEIRTARNEIRTARKGARKRKVDLGEVPARLAVLRRERSALVTAQIAHKAERHEAKRAELEALGEKAKARIKKARQAAAKLGLFWGSYNDIVQRADAGRKLGHLQFRGFRGGGTVTAQIMGGITVGQATSAAHNFFQLDLSVNGRKYSYARMRIGSNACRAPVWLEIPIVYHRPLPAHAVIKSVSMTRRILAGKIKWQLNVTLSLPKPAEKYGPAIAVDIGWRIVQAGVRVAYWQDEAGASGEVVVPVRDLDQFGTVESLASICDTKREEFLPQFAEWLGKLELPPEWQQQAAFLCHWRSNDRLAALIRWWEGHRLPEDGGWLYRAQEFRRKYLHLSNWQRNLQDQVVLRIREQYRVWAAGVAKRYGTVIVEEFDIRQLAATPEPEGAPHQKGAGNSRQRVSPSTLRGALRNACGREGVPVVALPAKWTTATCHGCGKRCDWDHAEIAHKCEHCGRTWDQDQNAAANLLQTWLASDGEATAVTV